MQIAKQENAQYTPEDNSIGARISRIKDKQIANGYIKVILFVANEILERK